VGLALGLAASACGWFISVTPFGHSIEDVTYDWRVRDQASPVLPDSPIVIVDINESSVRALERVVGRWPWPRLVHASAVEYLSAAGAKVIAYDVLFLEREGRSQTEINGRTVTGPQSDDALATAVQKAGNVLLLAETTYEGRAADTAGPTSTAILPGTVYSPGGALESRHLQMAFAELAGASSGVGHNYVQPDRDSRARSLPPFIDASGVAVPGLGIAAALAYKKPAPTSVVFEDRALRVGDVRLPLLPSDVDGPRALLRFRQPIDRPDGTTSVFPRVSFFDVLLSADQVANRKEPAIPRSVFKDKVVFVGTSAAGTYDAYVTPISRNVPGVELHATLADNVLSNHFMRRASPSRDLQLLFTVGVIAGCLAVILPAVWGTATVVALGVSAWWWLSRQIGEGVWLGAFGPVSALTLALFGGVTWQYLVEGRSKREIRRLFGRYVSKAVVEQLVAEPHLATLGGSRREMTVLFSDIRGFTTASEQGRPEDVVQQLNEHFSQMVEVLFRHDGTVDKFVGDMVMGLFGAPIPDPDHAEHAVQAALEMVARLDALNARWRSEGRPALEIGVGINTGEMIAGNIGSEAIMSYTVIGDAVNLGSRLESLNKEYGTRILISESTRRELRTSIPTRLIGPVVVKGRTQPVIVHEVLTRESR
jgi:adenylate cyclase